MSEQVAVILAIQGPLLKRTLRRGGGGGSFAALEELAQTLAASPAWADLPGAVMVLRPAPTPAIGIMGRFDARQLALAEQLRRTLMVEWPTLRHVSYEQAERDCEELARRLRRRLGARLLGECAFEAIPRGGLIVLGMLAYWLDLAPRQLQPARPNQPLVLVDDCSLSGCRLGQWLKQRPHPELIFAPLYSHPALRRAIRRQESSVRACISARDLADEPGPARSPSQLRAWRAWWKTVEPPGARYWIGRTERLSFAWSEPDNPYWDAGENQAHDGWRLASPAKCLRNRARLGRSGGPRLQVQPAGRGPLIPAERLLFGRLGERIVLGDQDQGSSFSLEGTAAEMWQALVEEPSRAEALKRLGRIYEVEPRRLRGDLERFAGELVARGLLRPRAAE